jgi:hypothetical protein
MLKWNKHLYNSWQIRRKSFKQMTFKFFMRLFLKWISKKRSKIINHIQKNEMLIWIYKIEQRFCFLLKFIQFTFEELNDDKRFWEVKSSSEKARDWLRFISSTFKSFSTDFLVYSKIKYKSHLIFWYTLLEALRKSNQNFQK